MVGSYVWVYTLKLLDNATLFSKEEVLKEYELHKNAENLKDLLYEKSVYPDGEKLGFYNISKFTLNDFKENYSKEKFNDYLNGFSAEVQELINLIRIIMDRDYPETAENMKEHILVDEKFKYIINKDYSDTPWNMLKKRFVHENKSSTNKEDIKWFINLFYSMNETYYNYEDYSNFLIDILFYNVDLKENISILYIEPDNYFIFQCFNYLLEKNPNLNIDLYVISHSLDLVLPLKFLSIVNKINVNFFIEEKDDSQNCYFDIYNELFNNNKTFDFIIQSDSESEKGFIPENKVLSTYNLNVSSRVVYFVPFGHNFIKREWLEKDIIESLIVLPIKKNIKKFEEDIYDSTLLIILNYDKPIERKNKFIIIDNTKNRDIISSEYIKEEYSNLINNDDIYNKSFKQFSKFVDMDSAKVISNNELLMHSRQFLDQFMKYARLAIQDDGKNNSDVFKNEVLINIADILYEVKMNSQKSYLKINYFENNPKKKECIITKQLNYEIEELGNLLKRFDQRLVDYTPQNYFYFSTNETLGSKWVFFDFEIVNPHLFRKVELLSSKVTLEYLYYFLNSEMGIKEYEYFMRGNISGGFPYFIKIRVPIPPKEIQDKIVESMNKGATFINEVNQLKKIMNNNFFNYELNSRTIDEFNAGKSYSEEKQEFHISDNWEYTLSGLVWPLAITYLLATSGGFEKVETANNLLRLFEFTTAFNTIVLISGLPEDIYEQYKTRIWDFAYDKRNNDNKFRNSLNLSFGSWVEFNNLLSSAYKKEFQTELNKEFYINLLKKEIRKIYSNLKDERNDEFHGGITNAFDAEILINELNIPKSKLFEHLNLCYTNFKLYYITGRNNSKTKEHEVIFLNGAYSMPIYSTVIYDGYLEPESLYLHDVVENTFSKLNDKLIKFEAIDETKRDWRLYIFIGFETKNNIKKAKYRCYQRREKDLIEDIDLNEFM